MLNVLRHYLPFRKVLLFASETVLITLVVMAVLSSHLWTPTRAVVSELAFWRLDPVDARWRVLGSSLMVAALAQLTLIFNELYDFRVSSSRYDRAVARPSAASCETAFMKWSSNMSRLHIRLISTVWSSKSAHSGSATRSPGVVIR